MDQIFINQIEIQISQNIYIKNVIELYSDSFTDMNELKIQSNPFNSNSQGTEKKVRIKRAYTF